jgi:hypothetical protein
MLELDRESLATKLHLLQELFPEALLETRALAGAIALDEARPPVRRETEVIAEMMRQVVEENRLLREQLAASEASRRQTDALVAALAQKFGIAI